MTEPKADPETKINKSGPVRKFTIASIQTHIDQSIAALEARNPDARGAVIAFATTTGVNLAVVGKKDLGGGQLAWTVVATKPWDGPFEAEAAVRYEW